MICAVMKISFVVGWGGWLSGLRVSVVCMGVYKLAGMVSLCRLSGRAENDFIKTRNLLPGMLLAEVWEGCWCSSSPIWIKLCVLVLAGFLMVWGFGAQIF